MDPSCCHHLNAAEQPQGGIACRRQPENYCGRQSASCATSRAWRPVPPGLFPGERVPCESFLPPLVFRSCGTSRAISTARLNTSPCLHLRPIYVVVCNGPWRDLILKRASCLDAFSTYPVQTPLPGRAPSRDNRCTGGLSNTVLSY